MARSATFRLYRRVLIHKRTANFGVALGADRVLVSSGLQVAVPEGAVRVVTVAALDQALIHLVVEGHVELRLLVGMALEAELGLRSLEQCASSLLP